MAISESEFRQMLSFERTLSEYKRIKIFTYILAVGFVLAMANLVFDLLTVNNIFKYRASIAAIILWLLFFLGYEFIFLTLVKKYVKAKRPLPKRFSLLHSVSEIFFPGIIIFILISIELRPYFLDSPFFFFFFILIAISALQLNFRISFLMGLFAAIQYVLLTFYTFKYIMPSTDIVLVVPESIYYTRAIMLLVVGIASGLIASEIQRKIESSFTQMIEKQNIINLFGQQVSKEIVDELVVRKDGLDTRLMYASIMFLDIRNFSTYAETKNPAEIIEYQNNIFKPLIEIISRHHGIVNQFLGDGFMASFGIPVNGDYHVQNAYNAGIEIISKIKELGENNIIPKTRVGIGLHCGEVITGNIGNEIRKQYSITGKTVIISSRIEQLNKQFHTEYLVTKSVLEKINLNGRTVESLGETAVKGFEKPVEVICVKV